MGWSDRLDLFPLNVRRAIREFGRGMDF